VITLPIAYWLRCFHAAFRRLVIGGAILEGSRAGSTPVLNAALGGPQFQQLKVYGSTSWNDCAADTRIARDLQLSHEHVASVNVSVSKIIASVNSLVVNSIGRRPHAFNELSMDDAYE
jgi:hypothetical protein